MTTILIDRGPETRDRVAIDFDAKDGMTKQSMKAETEINNILRKYVKSGTLTHLASNPGTYADVSEIGDYRAALEQVRSAEAMFMNLPARVRTRFDNDAAAFLDFVLEPGHEAELKELGLWAEGKVPEPAKVPDPVVDPSPPGGGSVRDPETGRFV